ncbi:TPA: hypothetical protein DF272_06255 [Candidatus Falkowbacteria bacterium]|nr:hypothetical protein [Candidatus Falkowbacteria bacterium]
MNQFKTKKFSAFLWSISGFIGGGIGGAIIGGLITAIALIGIFFAAYLLSPAYSFLFSTTSLHDTVIFFFQWIYPIGIWVGGSIGFVLFGLDFSKKAYKKSLPA